MPKRKLSPWCRAVKHAMLDRQLDVGDVAEDLHMTRPYTSSIINGRVYSAVAVKKISDYLGISDDYYQEEPGQGRAAL